MPGGHAGAFEVVALGHGQIDVIGGRADVRVHMVGRVPMLGSTAWPIPANFAMTSGAR